MTPCVTDPTRWVEATKPDPEAQALCHTCPIRTACLDRAVSGPRVMGIWGGLLLPDWEKFPVRHRNSVKTIRHALSVNHVA